MMSPGAYRLDVCVEKSGGFISIGIFVKYAVLWILTKCLIWSISTSLKRSITPNGFILLVILSSMIVMMSLVALWWLYHIVKSSTCCMK